VPARPEEVHARTSDTWVQGVRLHAYAGGPAQGGPDGGPAQGRGPVLVVPGLCVSAYLRPLCDRLAAAGLRSWLVDPPGWPHSAPPAAEPLDLAEVAAAVVGWLERRDLREVVVVGQSVGAQLGAHVAALAPDRVRGLVLQGPTFDPSARTPARAMWRLARDAPRERPSLFLSEAPEWLKVGLRRVRHTLGLALADRLEDTLRLVRCPVLLLVGEHDTFWVPGWADELGVGPPVHLPGLPHSSPYADPDGVARVVAGWVASLPPDRSLSGPRPGPEAESPWSPRPAPARP
jgi:pimeloyl-ACP methyl ester carboxylesterase